MTIKVERGKCTPNSLADMAHRHLEELIITLQLPPGSRWTEEALSEMIDIGRTPVREAVKRLQSDYLIKILPRHGLMVAEIDFDEQLRVVEMRRALEMFISSSAASRAQPDECRRLASIASAIEASGKHNDLVGYLREVFAANAALSAAARNHFAVRSISPLHALSRRFFYKYATNDWDLSTASDLHARRALAVAQQDVEAVKCATDKLMTFIEDYTRRAIALSAPKTRKLRTSSAK